METPVNREASDSGLRKLNVGCGLDIRPGWTNLDVVDYGGNQIVDINKYPWPFPENHFDHILCSHILEHLNNFNAAVTELYRVAKPEATIEVRVPFFLSTKYYSEPDHRIPFGIRSFDNYEELTGRKLKFYEKWKLRHRTNYGSPARFVVLEKRYNFSNFTILKWMNWWINLEPVMFERFLAGIFPPEEVVFKLRVFKSRNPAASVTAGHRARPSMSADSTESHLYSGLAAKARRFARRFGASELFWKPVRLALSPWVIPFLTERTFEFKGQTLRCFYHRYNITWAAERGVEIPIARSYLEARPGAKVLEVGNVLSHYYPSQYEVVDKFERGPRLINVDIVDYAPPTRYDLILSISTFEHIGYDDEASGSSGEKILAALANCRRLLSERGLLVITVPTGYNPDLDQLIRDGSLGASAEHFLCRTGRRQWRPCSKDEALKCRYRRPYPYANGLLVAEFTRAT